MRILADMPISPRTVDFLRRLGHEAIHALELGMARATDQEVERARSEGLAILTEDLDYGAILAATGEVEPGVVILRVGNWTREQIELRLERILEELPEESFRNSIVVVERHRVRFRRLPIRPEGSQSGAEAAGQDGR